MKKIFFGFRFKNMLMVSVLIGCLLGTFDAVAVSTLGQMEEPEGFYCPVSTVIVGGNTCSASGCRKSSKEPDSYWVCDYSGGECPPLQSCVDGGGAS